MNAAEAVAADPTDILLLWLHDPVQFVRDNFGVEPDEWQRDALGKIVGPGKHRLALCACAGPGKSCLDAWVILWFLALHAEGQDYPRGVCLSISKENLMGNLWAEISKWRDRSDFLKRVMVQDAQKIYHKDHPDRWRVEARAYSQSASPEEIGETLSGLHERFVLIVMDESGSMPPELLKKAEQALTTCEYGLILQSGNPLSRNGCLFAVEGDPRWEHVRITGDPDDQKRSPRVDIEWAREQIAKFGRTDPWVMAYILGLFPEASFNGLLSEAQIRAALGKHLNEHEWTWAQKRIGIDVAAYGDDRTVFAARQGRAAFPFKVFRQLDGPKLAAQFSASKARFGSEVDTIDATGGWANSMLDFARMAGHHILPVGMAEQADDPGQFANKRAECYWRAAEWVKSGGALPPDEELVREATASMYVINSRGRIQIEDKAQVKKRLGFSPDKWDAFCLTFAVAEQPARSRLQEVRAMERSNVMSVQRAEDDYQPWGNVDNKSNNYIDMLSEKNEDAF